MRPDKLDTARVFERVFAIYRLQARVLLPGALLVYAIPAGLDLVDSFSVRAVALAASVIAGVVYQGVVVQAARDIQDGVRDLSLGGLFRSVGKVLAPLVWTAILVGLGVFAGFLAFVIPGLILLTQWAVAAPVVVCEARTAPQAIGRSRQLVRGHGWQVFSVLIVTLLLVLLFSSALGALANTIASNNVTFAAAALIARTLTAPIFALASAVLYLELLLLKGESLPAANLTGLSDRP